MPTMKAKAADHSSASTSAQAATVTALAEAQLREAGVRVTQARVNVLGALLETRSAASHQDIQDRFADMDRVTLYRALDCLTEAGLAHKISSDDRIFRYSAGADHAEHGLHDHSHGKQHQHGHFKCTRCHRVFCLDASDGTDFLATVLPDADRHRSTAAQLQSALRKTLGKGFQSHEVELTIKGWCADCAD
ncbi:transcriptional repressor [Herbaspirillum sp. AP02]|uniref:Fur family transcriptional regulator n=1 Tax=unclassified Herbaspirillum TaxID=2624150 RepID=UPI0015D9CC4A|nr:MULTISPECIES: transcriptional repressor [unclassified Herbaspirillum]MBG7620876.1 transcriptional repressor [Herbaspirillum sp. AP02]NZD68339.1 transcriptional repressor [Herbaspirillum sp. AP21]